MKGKNIWQWIIGTWLIVSVIISFFNADLGATLLVPITFIFAVLGVVYLWGD